MKKDLIAYLLLLCTATINAQSLSVSSFRLLESDLTANTTGTIEKDQNGEVAALIKVVTTQTGFSFDGGALGIVRTIQKPSEIWVYVPRGLKKITISHPQLGILRDYYFDRSIEAAQTYEMVLVSGETQTIIKQSRTSQFVVFQLEPSNAVVEIDGDMLETNDGVATKLLKFGTYNYRIKAPNYQTEAGTIVVNNPNEKHIIKSVLTPNLVHVSIFVEDEAEIWVDGIKKGISKWTGELVPGIYEFEAKKKNHQSTSLTQDIVLSKEPLVITLHKPIPIYGEATIRSAPEMADVFIDNKLIGESPLMIPDLLVGEHSISIQKSGYLTHDSIISIKNSQTTYYSVKLKKSIIQDNSLETTEIGIEELEETDIPTDDEEDYYENTEIGIKELPETDIQTDDGGDYYGYLVLGKPDGYGRAVYKNGNMYEGYYVNGKRQGFGVYKFHNGEKYEGEWHQDLQHGEGIYYFSNDNRYEGHWSRGYQQGQGIMYYSNGDKYDGEWEKDKRSGNGTYTFANGLSFRAEWKDDKPLSDGPIPKRTLDFVK